MIDFSLNFSKLGSQVVAQYYNFLRLGKEGYRKIHSVCRDLAMYLAKEIASLEPFEIIYDGSDGIPALSWKLKNDADHGFNLFDFANRLRNRGWQVPAYTLPANMEDTVIQRILVRHGFSQDLADLLLDDFQRSLDHLKKQLAAQKVAASSMAKHKPSLLLRILRLAPRRLDFWIAILFMIGAALFALGCILFLRASNDELELDLIFFTGSIFFTSAAYCQLHLSVTSGAIIATWRQVMRQEFNWQAEPDIFIRLQPVYWDPDVQREHLRCFFRARLV